MIRNDDIVCMVGIPASGKSRYTDALKDTRDAESLCLDDYFYDSQGVYSWNPEADSMAWVRMLKKLEETIQKQAKVDPTPIVVDDIFLYLDRREQVIQMAMRHARPAVCVYLNTPLEVAIERNEARSPDRRIPEDVVRMMHKKMAYPTPTEGWRRIYRLDDKSLTLMWDRLTGKKSDKLEWAKKGTDK